MVTASVGSGPDAPAPASSFIYQTNLYDKYDTIYSGHVDASSGSSRPSVTISPKPGQAGITMVAGRVGFDRFGPRNATSETAGHLNGLYDYDPSSTKVVKVTKSAINRAGLQMHDHASFMSLADHNGVVYAGGNFSNADIRNIMSISDGNASALPEGGLNKEVSSMAVLGHFLYVGGSFTDAADGGNSDLQHVAAYSFGSETWLPLGAGVNGPVNTVLSLPLNVSRDLNETVVAVSGAFDQIRSFDNHPAINVDGFAVWVPSNKSWLQNLDVAHLAYSGQLSTFTQWNGTNILAGSLNSNGIAAGDAVSLLHDGVLSLDPLLTKVNRASAASGTYTGTFDTSSGRNLTILGGHFTVTTNKGSTIENLAIINGADHSVTGLRSGIDSNSTFLAMAVADNKLWAGGNLTGSVGDSRLNGFVAYDLANGDYVPNPPAPLTGDSVTVRTITSRPDSSEVYFGGDFRAAGSLPCPNVCYWDPTENQWNRPGTSLMGTVLKLQWASKNKLYAIGDLTVDGNHTAIAIYHTKKQKWEAFKGASTANVPGTVTAFSPASTDVSQFWLAGQASNGSSYVVEYDGSQFRSAGDIFGRGTAIRGLEALPLSKGHDNVAVLDNDLTLLITGELVVPNFGKASAALFNGTTLTPFVLSSTYDGHAGSVANIVTENQNPYSSGGRY